MSDDLVSQKRQLIEKCIEVVSTVFGETEEILHIHRAQLYISRNYTHFYKVYLATLDASGVNPTNWRCVVVSITSNRDSAIVDPSISCDSKQDF
jgi:hypothetical protein